MKIVITKDSVQATAETVADTVLLMSFIKTPSVTEKRGRHNAWKGKHKVECSHCHKKYKNIKLHTFKKHHA